MTTTVPAAMLSADVATQAKLDAVAAAKADATATVNLTGNQTIAGVKTFSSQPALPQALTLGTAVATTSGTSIDFTSIPSWVNRITVTLDSVSTTGANIPILQLGTSGGVETTGYVGSNGSNAGAAGAGGTSPTSGHGMNNSGGATSTYTGVAVITRMTSTKWVITSICTYSTSAAISYATTVKTLAGQLDRVRLTSVGSTDTFDAGSVNILYE